MARPYARNLSSLDGDRAGHAQRFWQPMIVGILPLGTPVDIVA